MLQQGPCWVIADLQTYYVDDVIIRDRSIVAECVDDEGITVADSDNLVKVIECGEDVITDWVMDHAE